MIDLNAAFKEAKDEYLKFERVENPRHPRRDIAAFLLLAELVPSTRPIVTASEHDEFFLDADCDALAAIATKEQIVELVRCGVRYDEGFDCFAMFS